MGLQYAAFLAKKYVSSWLVKVYATCGRDSEFQGVIYKRKLRTRIN
jgi:hypothetical protein